MSENASSGRWLIQSINALVDDGTWAGLLPGECAVLIVLMRHADAKGASFCGIARIAREAGVSQRSAWRSIASLTKSGIIKTARRPSEWRDEDTALRTVSICKVLTRASGGSVTSVSGGSVTGVSTPLTQASGKGPSRTVPSEMSQQHTAAHAADDKVELTDEAQRLVKALKMADPQRRKLVRNVVAMNDFAARYFRNSQYREFYMTCLSRGFAQAGTSPVAYAMRIITDDEKDVAKDKAAAAG